MNGGLKLCTAAAFDNLLLTAGHCTITNSKDKIRVETAYDNTFEGWVLGQMPGYGPTNMNDLGFVDIRRICGTFVPLKVAVSSSYWNCGKKTPNRRLGPEDKKTLTR